jgi:hypothetical protein
VLPDSVDKPVTGKLGSVLRRDTDRLYDTEHRNADNARDRKDATARIGGPISMGGRMP